jgi:hypothetical protein
MNMIKFLSLGQSLKESKDRTGVYKLELSPIVPKFEPTQRSLALETGVPFAKSTRASSASVADARLEAGRQTGLSASPRLPVARADDASGNAWKTMMRNLVGGSSPRRKSTVQGQIELNLEHVMVARNDLSDTDIEVVARGSKAARRAPETSFDGRQASGWMRLTQRLFSSNKDPFSDSASRSSAYCVKQTHELISRT